MIKIHNFARGGRGLRIAWQCEEMGLPYEIQHHTYPVGDAYRAINPFGNVPSLEDEGVAINELIAIMFYIAERYGPTPLLPNKDDPRLARVLQLMVFSEATFGAGMNTLMAAHFAAPDADKRNWSVRSLETRMQDSVDFLVKTLGDNDHLAGDFSLADIANVTALGMWKGALGKDIPEPLVAYRARLAERPAYQRAAKANGNT